MSLGRILVHVNDSEIANRRLKLAILLAKTHRAELVGFVNRPELSIPAAIDGYLPASSLKTAFEHAEKLVESTKDNFRNATAGLRLKSQVLVAHEPIEKALVHNSRLADLTIMGDIVAAREEQFSDTTSPIDFLLHSPRPVIFVPPSYDRETLGDHLLFAWDGGNRSTRALAESMPLLKKAKSCQILTINQPKELSSMELTIEDYLAAHKIQADYTQIKVRGNIGKALIEEANNMKADLIIQGGYAHHRLTEAVFGGTTKFMMEKMQIPTFMVH